MDKIREIIHKAPITALVFALVIGSFAGVLWQRNNLSSTVGPYSTFSQFDTAEILGFVQENRSVSLDSYLEENYSENKALKLAVSKAGSVNELLDDISKSYGANVIQEYVDDKYETQIPSVNNTANTPQYTITSAAGSSMPSLYYVLNTNSKKFHRSTCSYVDNIASKNRKDSTASRESIIDQGYSPCKVCNP